MELDKENPNNKRQAEKMITASELFENLGKPSAPHRRDLHVYMFNKLKNNLFPQGISKKNAAQKNHFNDMPIELVTKFFKQLTTEFNKDSEHYLTESELQHFINRAFYGNSELNKLTLNFSKDQIGFAISLFFYFYTISKNGYDHLDIKANRLKYKMLILDNFENFSGLEELEPHFRKYRLKDKWPITTKKQLLGE